MTEGEARAASVGLPPRPFLYTLDQVADLIEVDLHHFRAHYIYYEGRSTGRPRIDLLRAINVAPVGKRPEYRILESELVRWLKRRRIRVYDRAAIRFGPVAE